MPKLAELTQRLGHPFYLIQIFLPLVFFVIRYSPPLANAILFNDPNTPPNITLTGELKAYSIVFGFLVFKLITSTTAEEFVSVVGLYGKLLNVFMFHSYNNKSWLVGYTVLWVALFALMQQPPYRGPSKIVPLTPDELRTRVMRKQPEPKIVELDDAGQPVSTESSKASEEEVEVGAAKHYVVLFWAQWSIACLNFEGVVAELSLEYSTKDLVFAKFDIDQDSSLASELMISDSSLSPADLPTLILFTKGKEVARLPELVFKSDEDNVTGFGDKLPTEKVRDTRKDMIKRLAWNRSRSSVVNTFNLGDLWGATKSD